MCHTHSFTLSLSSFSLSLSHTPAHTHTYQSILGLWWGQCGGVALLCTMLSIYLLKIDWQHLAEVTHAAAEAGEAELDEREVCAYVCVYVCAYMCVHLCVLMGGWVGWCMCIDGWVGWLVCVY